MTIDWHADPQIQILAAQLRQGAVIAYPTEAVWGLGCDPNNRQAVERLLALKQRSVEKGLILIAGNWSQVRIYTEGLTEAQGQTLRESWPGPNTWLIPAEFTVPAWVRGKHSTVAIRVSAHPIVQALCSAFGGPVVSTSANPQGEPAALSPTEVSQYFGETLDGIAPGELGNSSAPSAIRDLLTGASIR